MTSGESQAVEGIFVHAEQKQKLFVASDFRGGVGLLCFPVLVRKAVQKRRRSNFFGRNLHCTKCCNAVWNESGTSASAERPRINKVLK